MPTQQITPSLLSLTLTEIAANSAQALSKGSMKLPTTIEKGELTFISRGYKMKAQPSQFTPQLTNVSVPMVSVRMTLRHELSI